MYQFLQYNTVTYYLYLQPFLPTFAPPPPVLSSVADEDSTINQAMHTMLLSWYMTGYNTGYYEGLKKAKTEFNKKHRHGRQKNKN